MEFKTLPHTCIYLVSCHYGATIVMPDCTIMKSDIMVAPEQHLCETIVQSVFTTAAP